MKLETISLRLEVEMWTDESPRPDLSTVISADLNGDHQFLRQVRLAVDNVIASRRVKCHGRKVTITGE